MNIEAKLSYIILTREKGKPSSPNIICKQNETLGISRGARSFNIFIYKGLSAFLWEGRKNVELPNIFGIIKGIFRIESDRAD